MISDLRRVLGLTPVGIVLTGIMLASIPFALAAAAAGSWMLAAGAVAIGQFIEWYPRRGGDGFDRILTRALLDVHLRSALRSAAMPVLLAANSAAVSVQVAAWLVWLLWLVVSAAGQLVDSHERTLDGASARGIGPAALLPKPEEQAQLDGWPHTAAILLVVALTPLLPQAGWVGVGLLAFAVVAHVLVLVSRLRQAAILTRSARMTQLNEALSAYRPEVVVYGGGQASTGYQVNVWLSTLERLNQRVLVITQSPALWAELKDSTVPVLCVQKASEYLTLDLSTVRLAMYPGNNGTNINILRLPHIRHVFIGHGDSDKAASINPFIKVYDEVWTAGQAGQDRFPAAGVEIPEDHFVHVGRPQLTELATVVPRQRGKVPTILYAPTWEGWTLEEHHTSLLRVGVKLVKALQQAAPEVRIIFRPHPLTGTRVPGALTAQNRIAALLPEGDVSYPGSSELYDSFREADLLITDVSSVVSDFLATGKPYAVVNTTGLPAAEFCALNPTVSAAYLIDGALNGLAEALAAVQQPDGDTLAGQRAQLRAYTLGPIGSDEPFQQAVDRAAALAAAAGEKWVMA